MPPPPRSGALPWLGVLLAFLVATAATAAYLVLAYAPKVRKQAIQAAILDLAQSADERQNIIQSWMQDQISAVQVVARQRPARRVALGPERSAPLHDDREHMREVLVAFAASESLSRLFVVDASGAVVVTSSESPPSPQSVAASATHEPGATSWIAVHQEGERPVVQFVAVIGDTGGRVVAEAPSENWLCPTVARNPRTENTADVTLTYRSGDRIVPVCVKLMGERLPSPTPVDPALPAVAALRRGRADGLFRDYRGQEVIAAARRLDPWPWALALKVDRAEVDGAVDRDIVKVASYCGVLLVGAGAFLALTVHYRQRRRELLDARVAARQAALLDRANDAILFVRLDGRIADVNRTAEKLYGRPREALIGLHVLHDLRPPDEQVSGARQFEAVTHTGSIVFETVHLAADGSRIPVEVSSRRVFDSTGEVVVSVIRDIRERKAAVRRIERLNRLLQTLSAANELLVRADDEDVLLSEVCRVAVSLGGFDLAWVGRAEPDGAVRPVASASAVAGAAEDYLSGIQIRWDDSPLANGPTGRSIRERRTFTVGDAGVDEVVKPWREALERQGFTSSSGTPILLRERPYGALNLYSKEPDFFDRELCELVERLAGDLGFGLQALHDRRQLAESERALAEQRKLFERINSLAPVAIYLYDRELRRTVYSNHRHRRDLGWGDDLRTDVPDEKLLAEIVHPDDLAALSTLAVSYDHVADGELVPLEYRLRHKDGSYHWMEGHHVVFTRCADGRPKQVLGIAQDVTERRRLQEQFTQAQKMESIGRLAGGVAHDFNNLLTAIIGYSELLRATLPAGNDGALFVDEIAKASARAASLTAQLLAFARRQVIEPRVVEVNAVVADAERMLHRLVGEDVELLTALSADAGATLIDPGQLQQVLVNLAVNARDAMLDGGRLIIETSRVSLDEQYARQHLEARAGDYALIAVSDTGSGIPPEVRDHIFEPFFTTKEVGKGTGLGLATCHGIVSQAGGHISVYSEVGLGTTFRVHLPLATPAGGAGDQAASRPAPPRGGRETVLLVEDDPLVRPMAALTLRSYGYRVFDASNGRDAIELARAHAGDLDLLVTDVVMPGIGGRELAREIAEVCPRARILFMSGHAESAIAHHGVLAPGVNFLPKPFTPERLARRVRALFDGN